MPSNISAEEHQQQGQQRRSRPSFFLLPAKANCDSPCTLALSPRGFSVLMMTVEGMWFSPFRSRGWWEAGETPVNLLPCHLL